VPRIGHVCVVGDRRPHLAALIVLEPAGLADDHAKQTSPRPSRRSTPPATPRADRVARDPPDPCSWRRAHRTLKLRRHRIIDKHSDTIAGSTTAMTRAPTISPASKASTGPDELARPEAQQTPRPPQEDMRRSTTDTSTLRRKQERFTPVPERGNGTGRVPARYRPTAAQTHVCRTPA